YIFLAVVQSFFCVAAASEQRPRMSGRPPPKGPRALSAAGPSSSSTAPSSSSLSVHGPPPLPSQRPPPSSHYSKPIPTGPRSLHSTTRFSHSSPKTPYNGFSNNSSFVNSAGPSMPNGLNVRDSQSSRFSSSTNGKKTEI